MASGLTIRTFKPSELTEMYLAFLDAFSDYEVPFRLSKEQFVRKFVQKLQIDFSLSVGAFDYDALAGFIFTSVSYYNGKLTAYNGGTGVRPYYRGRKIPAEMISFLIPRFQQKHIKRCILEVLVNNNKAIKSYESIGFEKTKLYKCYQLKEADFSDFIPQVDLEIFSVKSPNWELYETFLDYPLSFLDSNAMVNANISNETIIEIHSDYKCVGYVIYQTSFNRISQIGVSKAYRGKGVGKSLINYLVNQLNGSTLSIVNVDEQVESLNGFLNHLGFQNHLDQYEMELAL
ncbi:GNAT family N-acetyltransferase [Fulvivirga ligni]|uniref:GNAT family N-acetyltransferase n=1 Tax=Fulvivirga ligni TaxID=2904246 RepID=UPI001F48594C|nr:GNAT family N-acetyltransferase [Fulvivirga ligni]UII22516.1 GNAT family N-acetyltransferase [Fulvivirga ligni]